MKSPTLSALALVSIIQTSFAASCEAKDNVKITFYGWPDNSPPGPANAFNCGRGESNGEPIAGGSGTYTDPISFATATDNTYFPQCGIVYVPSLRKYFRNEDDCAECKTDFDNGGAFHIDLWTGSNTEGGGQTQIDCEDNLPGGQLTIINDPPNSLPVDTTALFDPTTSSCYKTTYPVADESSLCSGGSSSGSSSTPPSASAFASSSASDTTPASSSPPLSISPPVTSPAGSGGGGGQSSHTKAPSSAPYTPSTLATSTVSSATSSGSGSPGCVWEGHCLGAPCQTYNDCDGTNVCGSSGVCVPYGSS